MDPLWVDAGCWLLSAVVICYVLLGIVPAVLLAMGILTSLGLLVWVIRRTRKKE